MIFHQGPQSIKQISEKFDFTPSAGTQMVNHLVKEKLLTRKEDKTDRRKTCVELTTNGNKIVQKAQKLRFEKIKKMFKPLSIKELQQLKVIYSKIIDRLQ